ncbi:transposase [Prolixibacter denitrificans]|uniref:Transposase IS200 family protein n=1 Tax=Prolixibacter denitrificans TaxID=1541063 RepID=A0A2P8CFD7_9BACT|nr:transposase [Prolixibacter denitrificans]PSK83695.1 transposase IS200 family protein [Prolixibacter denitrificans]GET23240.1 hypothetical protein JCM18694_34860 [Prolixibacter denitrificans]
MPVRNINTPIESDRYYHIFNRGNGSLNLFYTPNNYQYFLNQYSKYLGPYCDTLAYCLLPNHFHLLIKTKRRISDSNTVGKVVSEHFRRLFITYSQAIKKQNGIKGSLFSRPFKRLLIEDEDYLKYVTFYIHHNPVKHGLSEQFLNYRFSSYQALTSSLPTNLNRRLVLDLFGGKENFLSFHNYYHEEKKALMLE